MTTYLSAQNIQSAQQHNNTRTSITNPQQPLINNHVLREDTCTKQNMNLNKNSIENSKLSGLKLKKINQKIRKLKTTKIKILLLIALTLTIMYGNLQIMHVNSITANYACKPANVITIKYNDLNDINGEVVEKKSNINLNKNKYCISFENRKLSGFKHNKNQQKIRKLETRKMKMKLNMKYANSQAQNYDLVSKANGLDLDSADIELHANKLVSADLETIIDKFGDCKLVYEFVFLF